MKCLNGHRPFLSERNYFELKSIYEIYITCFYYGTISRQRRILRDKNVMSFHLSKTEVNRKWVENDDRLMVFD